MSITVILLISIVFAGLLTYLITLPMERPSTWGPCTYCHKCKQHYSQVGLIASVYTCPTCGNSTSTGYSFKYSNGKFEVLNKRNGKRVN